MRTTHLFISEPFAGLTAIESIKPKILCSDEFLDQGSIMEKEGIICTSSIHANQHDCGIDDGR